MWRAGMGREQAALRNERLNSRCLLVVLVLVGAAILLVEPLLLLALFLSDPRPLDLPHRPPLVEYVDERLSSADHLADNGLEQLDVLVAVCAGALKVVNVLDALAEDATLAERLGCEHAVDETFGRWTLSGSREGEL